ncbi:hypothetical protein PH203_49440, partial [Streptomyces sp. S.PB5]|nr:hypothetical protein [Streptomyces sp. S.PB5]
MADRPDELSASEQEAGGARRADIPAPQQPQPEPPLTDDEAALTSVTQASEAAVAEALSPVLDVEASLAALKRRLAAREPQAPSAAHRPARGLPLTFRPLPQERSRAVSGQFAPSKAAVSTVHRVPAMAGAAAIDFVWLSDDREWLQLVAKLTAAPHPQDLLSAALEVSVAPNSPPTEPEREASAPTDGGALDLLPMVFADPNEALARAQTVLASDPPPWSASIAHQVIGIWQRDWGDLRIALRHLRRARDLAARAQAPEREADTLAALGVALVHAGHVRQGLEAMDRAVQRGTGHTRARVLFRRAYVGWVLGRHREALEDIRRAIPVLRQVGDVIWTARALTLRATVHLALGAVERADADFTAAEALWDATGQNHDKADAVESRGLAAFRSGDLPVALRLLDEAKERYARLGTPSFMLSIRRCEVLMAASLAPEALAEADSAIEALDKIGGQSTRKAELLLLAARAALLA